MKEEKDQAVSVDVDTGICGFPCRIKVWKTGKRAVGLEITGTDCRMINQFAITIDEITMKQLFLPLTKNPIFIAAEKACCHNACPVPSAVVKAVEVALGLALKKDVTFRFDEKKAT